MIKNNPFTELGLDSSADADDIKTAWHFLTKRYHPDYSHNIKTEIKFKSILNAYRTLEVCRSKDKYFKNPIKQKNPELLSIKGDIFALGRLLVTSSDIEVRKFALRYLGYSGKKASWIFLRNALYDTNEEIILCAVQSIIFLMIESSREELPFVFLHGSDNLKKHLLELASNNQEHFFLSMLQIASKDKNFAISFKAKKILLQFEQEVLE